MHVKRITALVVAGLASMSTLTAGASPTHAAARSTSSPAAPVGDSAAPTPLPPQLVVRRRSASTAAGYVFIAPKGFVANGPEILDDRGRPVWWNPISNGDQATDFRVQTYLGKPVLTWWQGTGFGGMTHGVDYIADTSYHVIATVRAGNGLEADGHEFLLTPDGNALITAYQVVPYDLSSLGGPKDGQVIEGVIQEVDVATGRVVFEWHSLDHIPLTDSYIPVDSPYDYFHINSIELDSEGNLVISARHTWTVYKLDRRTGKIVWRLGGKRSDFSLGPGVRFSGQHDARAAGPDTIRLFDNGDDASPAPHVRFEPDSRVIWIHLDASARTATLAKAIAHPDAIAANSQGNAQPLDNGDTFVGWGNRGRLSELDAQGSLLFDAALVGGDTYRGYRFEWAGQPDTPPLATARRSGRHSTTVHAIWNGATAVASWRILAGRSAKSLRPGRTVTWNSLDTAITIRTTPRLVEVVAVDAQGHVLGTSAPVRVR